MAVSNAIASNVVDILVALGVPWTLKTVIVDPGSSVSIDSGGLIFSAVTLLLTSVFVAAVLSCNGWRLTRGLGGTFMVSYMVVLAVACMYMMNVFGGVQVIVHC